MKVSLMFSNLDEFIGVAEQLQKAGINFELIYKENKPEHKRRLERDRNKRLEHTYLAVANNQGCSAKQIFYYMQKSCRNSVKSYKTFKRDLYLLAMQGKVELSLQPKYNGGYNYLVSLKKGGNYGN